jgi:hypothetical protein
MSQRNHRVSAVKPWSIDLINEMRSLRGEPPLSPDDEHALLAGDTEAIDRMLPGEGCKPVQRRKHHEAV